MRNLAFSQNGQILASVGDDGTLALWDVPAILNLQPLDYACEWVGDYLQTNETVPLENKDLC